MGLFDFINKREGDFIPLRTNDNAPYGPGPLIVMYAVPKSMDDEELRDMVEDGMPNAKDVVIRRIAGSKLDDDSANTGDALLNLSVQEALESIIKEGSKTQPRDEFDTSIVSHQHYSDNDPCPVLYFSGVANNEMMDGYRIIANEVFEETNGVHWPACAKVVQPALQKSLRQVLFEISSDHADAMKLRKDSRESES